jgi:TonB family protein
MRRPCLLAIILCAAATVGRADPEPPMLEAVFLKDYSTFEGGYGAAGPYYPAAAAAGELNGEAVLRCTLTVKGRLKSCAVVSDEPSGLYFGAAALAMASSGVITARPPAPLAADAAVRVHVPFVLDR